jgi:hypothetical protein
MDSSVCASTVASDLRVSSFEPFEENESEDEALARIIH